MLLQLGSCKAHWSFRLKVGVVGGGVEIDCSCPKEANRSNCPINLAVIRRDNVAFLVFDNPRPENKILVILCNTDSSIIPAVLVAAVLAKGKFCSVGGI